MTGRTERLRVGIIGSGFGGIALAVKLKARTDTDFVIFEQDSGVGGTWWQNRYPGCEVDIPSHVYSFSFIKWDWPRTHATQPELQNYAERVVDVFGLRDRIRLNTKVDLATWDDTTHKYTIRTAGGDEEEFDFVVSSVGLLNVPRYPDWPGLDEFEGIKFHTSRWEHDQDLSGKRIAVVGTGSTAVQVGPAIAPIAESVTVYQREPGWIEPKHERAYTPRERWFYRNVPFAQRAHRLVLMAKANNRFKAYDSRTRMQKKMQQLCLDFITTTIDDPQVRAAVTPDYAWGCKRPIVASTFYPSLNRSNVSLVPHAVARVTKDGLVDATGTERKFDVLIMSTGFQPQRFLNSIDVRGRGGRSLHDAWAERATAFLGVTVPGFPNFFVLYGPNTNGGTSIIAQLERQAELAVKAISRIARGSADVVDTDPSMLARWTRWIDEQLDTHASAMNSGCHNYYTSENGANVTQWPRTHWIYYLATRFLARRGLVFAETERSSVGRTTADASMPERSEKIG
ncbi:NAD(P)/FAD-dependent oxidoreductase [Microbacterium sp.]|uniref:flavin-containing monooxygenase n=1 Tax=Microbacterium sp. TaxID=51671 RepID=UPI002736DF45|nr:NAD(P)/FAD-dependent oxidoreductase [Microbacterium sp.]MDP3951867.1 NAD(P)/FAD-dependent oxidoreductase [Microbacterium sp.]